MCDTKKKYLKYKKKYNLLKSYNINQHGGTFNKCSVITNNPMIQSWLYMPIILAPFDNIILSYNPIIDTQLKKFNFEYTIERLIEEMTKYYRGNYIDLSDYNNLLRYSYIFDSHLHLTPQSQELLLTYAKLKDHIDTIIYAMCNNYDMLIIICFMSIIYNIQ